MTHRDRGQIPPQPDNQKSTQQAVTENAPLPAAGTVTRPTPRGSKGCASSVGGEINKGERDGPSFYPISLGFSCFVHCKRFVPSFMIDTQTSQSGCRSSVTGTGTGIGTGTGTGTGLVLALVLALALAWPGTGACTGTGTGHCYRHCYRH